MTRDDKSQTKQSSKAANETNTQTKQKQKSPKQKKTKPKEEPVIIRQEEEEEEQQQPQPSIPFTLDDENAFPVLGQATSVSATKESDHNTSTKVTGK